MEIPSVTGYSLLSNRPIQLEKVPQTPPASKTPTDETRFVTAGQGRTIDRLQVMRDIEAIADNPNLTDKDKRRMINDLRKQLGLSKGEMKRYFTKPLERKYARRIDEIKRSGPITPEKKAEIDQLEQKRKLYAGMYKPGGCIKKMFKGIGGFFKGVGKALLGTVTGILNPANWIRPSFWKNIALPLALSFIPGIGIAASALYGATTRVKQVVDKGISYYRKGLEWVERVSERPRQWIEKITYSGIDDL